MGGVAESAPSGVHDDVLLWISCMGGLEKRDLLGEGGGREDASVGNGGYGHCSFHAESTRGRPFNICWTEVTVYTVNAGLWH